MPSEVISVRVLLVIDWLWMAIIVKVEHLYLSTSL